LAFALLFQRIASVDNKTHKQTIAWVPAFQLLHKQFLQDITYHVNTTTSCVFKLFCIHETIHYPAINALGTL